MTTGPEHVWEAPSAALLRRLLAVQGMSLSQGAAEQAWAEAFRRRPAATDAVSQMRSLGEALRRWMGPFDAAAEVAVVPVQTLLAQHFPALVLCEGRWRVARWLHGERLGLEANDGGVEEVERARCGAAPACWVALSGAGEPDVRAGPLRLVGRALAQRKRVLFEVGLASVLVNAFAVIISLFAMQVYDRVVPTFAWSTLWALTVGVLVVLTFDAVLRLARAQALDRVARDVDEDLTQLLYDHLLAMRMDSRPRSLGTLAARLTGFEAVRSFFTASILFVFVDLPFVLAFIAVIALVGGAVGWVYALLFPLALVAGWAGQRKMRRLVQRQVVGLQQKNGLLIETIHGAESIKAAGAEWRFSARWADLGDELSADQLAVRATVNRVTTLMHWLSSIAFVGVIVVGVHQIELGLLSVGGLIACSILGGRVIQPISQVVMLATQWHGAREAIRNLESVMRLPAEREPDVSQLAPDSLAVSIAAKDLRFAYGRSPAAHIDINALAFNAGERVALVGSNGSGKTTLLRILSGHYRPAAGQVRIGGIDAAQLSPACLGAHVGYMPQDIRLFRGSLRDNIELGGVRLDDSRLLEVVRANGLETLVSEHPQGLDLPIAEDGSGLSVGQRQQVGLARLLAQPPRIWLLDEPSASLDGSAEAALVKTLTTMIRPDDLVIYATHKTALLAMATRVLVMRGGRVVHDGDRDSIGRAMQSPSPISASSALNRVA
jgi:ATP-binding cassette subfamily C protein LapB